MKIVAFLQNAWSPSYAGRAWPRRSWLKALERSRSGQRLRVLTAACRAGEFWFDNTTPHVGDNPDSVIPADLDHMSEVLRSQSPQLVLALGRQAGAAMKLVKMDGGWDGPILVVPHPAHRLVTNTLYEKAGRLLDTAFDGIVELKQEIGRVKMLRTKTLFV